MASGDVALPIIDLSGYIDPKSPGDKERVIAQVRDAARQYGFFQAKGHGVPLNLQRDLLRCMSNVFNLPKDEKLKMSFLENPCRRGYEASGMSHREGDALPDAKEVRTISKYLPHLLGFLELTIASQVLLCRS
jgi:isopenicillin N synthase-like dioxygenase